MNKKRLIAFSLSAFIILSAFELTHIFNSSAVSPVGIQYQGHVQSIGWQNPVENGQEAGTDGKSLRVEATKITLLNIPTGAHILYQAQVQNIGWQSPVEDGQEAGTDGQSLRVEAIKIALKDLSGYSVQYRVHVQNIGWMPWVSDGQTAGTTGQSLRIETIEIKVIPTTNGSTPTPQAFETPTPVQTVRTSISGVDLANKLPSLGFTRVSGTTSTWEWDSKPNDITTNCGVIYINGNSIYFTLTGNTTIFDNDIKTIFNWILPTKGNLLYSTVSNTFSNQTQNWDGRSVELESIGKSVAVNIN